MMLEQELQLMTKRKKYMTSQRFDLIAALYAFTTHYHSGQFSRGYRIHSRICTAYNPRNIPCDGIMQGDEEWENAHLIYQDLVKKYANLM